MGNIIPKVVFESTVTVAGRALRVYQLDNGQRVINCDDMHAFVADLEAGRARITPEDAALVAEQLRGGTA